ncbi:serine/threonine-protein kinase [Nocardia sp. NPDC050435]|uniref:serine/threonine-protein kinase n=1 Tax=Nocardia sp. NPDC050435 TaxID=3155040 RepID=UPI0033D38379
MLDRGDVFAGYRIEGTLGRGGMGAVYLARRPAMPGPVALKLLNSEVSADPDIRARFEDEAEVVARLHHPGIVAVYESGIEDARLWMAMQYVDGRDATVVSPRSLPPDRVIALAGATAAALDYAHAAGVLHRDVKPANILLARPTRTRREAALLTDFGIARLRDEPVPPAHSGTILATLAYAAPEQLRGLPLDHHSDQYSLACTLFRMLTGALPHAATNPAAMIKGHLHDPPQPVATLRPELPATLDHVMARALAKRPAERFATCTEFVDAVRAAFVGPAIPPLYALHKHAVVAPQRRMAPVAAPSPPPEVPTDSGHPTPMEASVIAEDAPTARLPAAEQSVPPAESPTAGSGQLSEADHDDSIRAETGRLAGEALDFVDDSPSVAGHAVSEADSSTAVQLPRYFETADAVLRSDRLGDDDCGAGWPAAEEPTEVLAVVESSGPRASATSIPDERKPVGVRATCLEIAPQVFLARGFAPPPQRPTPHRRPPAIDRARLGYYAMLLAALLLVLIALFG